MAALISASITPVLAPLVAQLEADRQTIERQGETIRDQAETIGRQSAELDAARAQISTLTASGAPRSAEPIRESPAVRSSSTTWLTPRRFWIIAALVLVLGSVGVVQVTALLFSMAAQLATPQ